jgi:hypothetical protein
MQHERFRFRDGRFRTLARTFSASLTSGPPKPTGRTSVHERLLGALRLAPAPTAGCGKSVASPCRLTSYRGPDERHRNSDWRIERRVDF